VAPRKGGESVDVLVPTTVVYSGKAKAIDSLPARGPPPLAGPQSQDIGIAQNWSHCACNDNRQRASRLGGVRALSSLRSPGLTSQIPLHRRFIDRIIDASPPCVQERAPDGEPWRVADRGRTCQFVTHRDDDFFVGRSVFARGFCVPPRRPAAAFFLPPPHHDAGFASPPLSCSPRVNSFRSFPRHCLAAAVVALPPRDRHVCIRAPVAAAAAACLCVSQGGRGVLSADLTQ